MLITKWTSQAIYYPSPEKKQFFVNIKSSLYREKDSRAAKSSVLQQLSKSTKAGNNIHNLQM
jgi:hypothetical protein